MCIFFLLEHQIVWTERFTEMCERLDIVIGPQGWAQYGST
jgi:hypothetical protein